MNTERDLVTPVRWFVGAVVTATVALSSAGFWFALRDPSKLGTDEITDLVEAAGIPVEAVIVIALVLPLVVATFVAGLILLRRPDTVLVLVFALSVVTMSATVSRSLVAVTAADPWTQPAVDLIHVLAVATFGYFLLVFPGNRFRGWKTATFWIASIVLVLTRPSAFDQMTVRRLDASTTPTDLFYFGAYAVLFTVIFSIQFLRYRRASGQARVQMKWVMLPVSALGTYVTAALVVPSFFIELPPRYFAIAMLGATPLGIAFPVCLARGVLKYRLYDIDIVINRALVYAALTAVLAGVYVGLVFLFQSLLAPVTADSDLAVAGSTLAVAALFRPVRSRLQDFIDRRFYRRKFDVQRTLEEFGNEVRDEVDLASLSLRLERVVQDTMQPAHLCLWLRGQS